MAKVVMFLRIRRLWRMQQLLRGRGFSSASQPYSFDIKHLDVLCCPISKGKLRHEDSTNELISDQIGVAYPIIRGIPHLIPQDARIIKDPDALEADMKGREEDGSK
eukprot:gb/GECG01001407.1/.p1 GENE.gb/GECG01001407.1/~~gb/GECG01001407.1/.p1  ORF type:complete len:106 (+),score=9.99 gb/GECG01001407.1/:1-318(+)